MPLALPERMSYWAEAGSRTFCCSPRLVPLWLQVLHITARKTHQEEKLLPQICWRGGWGGVYKRGILEQCCVWLQYWHTWLCCVCFTLGIPPPCQERPYCSWLELKCHFLRSDLVLLRACVSHASWHAPLLVVCMPYVVGGRLRGHGATRSLGVRLGERKQA